RPTLEGADHHANRQLLCRASHLSTPSRHYLKRCELWEQCRCRPRPDPTIPIRFFDFPSRFWIISPLVPPDLADGGSDFLAQLLRRIDAEALDARQVADELAGLGHGLQAAVVAPHEDPA